MVLSIVVMPSMVMVSSYIHLERHKGWHHSIAAIVARACRSGSICSKWGYLKSSPASHRDIEVSGPDLHHLAIAAHAQNFAGLLRRSEARALKMTAAGRHSVLSAEA